MKIAITYICTGKYERFWNKFYETCERFFYPEHEKHYFVFTESKSISIEQYHNVTKIYQNKVGWPYDTLLRFHWISMIQDQLYDFDYCYFCNANSVFIDTITEDVIPFPTEKKPLIFWCHTAHYDHYSSNDITTECNEESTAYIGANVKCRQHGGGFYGGTTSAFVRMTLDLRNNIQKDLNKDIIAVWHDQSHIIKYACEHDHLEVGRDLICQEEKKPVNGKCVMVFLAKEKNGGIDNLRDNNLKKRSKHFIIRVYHLVLVIFDTIGLGNLLRGLAKKYVDRRDWYR